MCYIYFFYLIKIWEATIFLGDASPYVAGGTVTDVTNSLEKWVKVVLAASVIKI